MPAPTIEIPLAQQVFHAELRKHGLDPVNRWIGGYVDYEWCHGRHIFENLGVDLKGLRVLEFGCNYGASAIVLAHLGATVTAVDVDARFVELARLNAAQYRLPSDIAFSHEPDSLALPYPDESFDLVVCNSVLNCVPDSELKAVQESLDRVLKTGGMLLIMGTSNRLAARELHSRRWLVNYLPKRLDRYWAAAGTVQRGISPFAARNGFGPEYHNLDHRDSSASFLLAKRRMGVRRLKLGLLALVGTFARPFGWSVGMLTPSISLRLEKQARREAPVR